MIKTLNQFRRIYSDDGRSDRDFTQQETRLREAQEKLVVASARLMRASEDLNTAALKALPVRKDHH